MNKSTFTVLGEPTAKARPRFSRGRTFTPQKTKEKEQEVINTYNENVGYVFEGYLKLSIDMYFKVPKSDTKKNKELKLANILRPSKKPDIDNVIKLILDALNGVAYVDDVQVIELSARKFYSDTPRVEVTIDTL